MHESDLLVLLPKIFTTDRLTYIVFGALVMPFIAVGYGSKTYFRLFLIMAQVVAVIASFALLLK